MFDEHWRLIVAIALAVIDASCFAAAAVLQQRAVRRTVGAASHPSEHRIGLSGLAELIRHPGWLFGAGLMGLGVLLHMVALALAPVSVIQPIGVLGVPLAVLLAARLGRTRPSSAVVVPILVCVIGIGGFVAMVSGRVVPDASVPLTELMITEGAVLAVIAAAATIAHRVHGWRRCLLNAVAGAVAVGMVSALVRAIAGQIDGDPVRLFDPAVLVLVAMALLNAAAGGWLVQQAYASGPADVVLACLTVVDPMVAVMVGLALLGEGAALGPAAVTGMIIFAAVAVAGVFALARSHPQLSRRPSTARPQTVSDRPVADHIPSDRPTSDRTPADLQSIDA